MKIDSLDCGCKKVSIGEYKEFVEWELCLKHFVLQTVNRLTRPFVGDWK